MSSRRQRRHAIVLVGLGLWGCAEGAEPPGRSLASAAPEPSLTLPAVTSAAAPAPAGSVASIAMRTWIYQLPDEHSTKLGYLRAGAVVARSGEPAGTKGCAGGWYGVEPRGYVCVGMGATLELGHDVVRAVVRGPRRGEPMPYRYVISRKPPPPLYFRLASEAEQLEAEGKRRARGMALMGGMAGVLYGEADPVPSILASGQPLPKPYGADRGLHVGSHRGRAGEDSAFGLIGSFDWTGRRIGLTTELDLIPLDRMRPAILGAMRGIVIDAPGVPAFVVHHGVETYRPDAGGKLRPDGRAGYRSGWVLTGKDNGSPRGLLETTAGVWLPAANLRVAQLREDPAGFARDGRKWIDVSIRRQLLVAYEGRRPVYATLVSSGRGEMGDPETTHATVRGTFMIHAKHVSATMDGDEDTRESFDLRDVPYVQYFHKGFALHGAYWHDDFGKVRSHGCVNLAPADAAWLFEWTEPMVPGTWHGALNLAHGTLVYLHG